MHWKEFVHQIGQLPRIIPAVCVQCPVWLFALFPIVIIIIIILVITSMHGIYNYIHETNHVSRVHSVAAVLYLEFVLHVMLFRTWNLCFYISTSHSVSAACKMAVICSSLVSCFPGMLLRYCLSNFEMIPIAYYYYYYYYYYYSKSHLFLCIALTGLLW